jgi:hypothetical protein
MNKLEKHAKWLAPLFLTGVVLYGSSTGSIDYTDATNLLVDIAALAYVLSGGQPIE